MRTALPCILAILLASCLLASHLPMSHAADHSLKHEITVQRACEAAIWAMSAVSVYDIELSIQRDLGGKFGDIAYFSQPMTSRHGFLTANDVTPYVVGAFSCQGDRVGLSSLEIGKMKKNTAGSVDVYFGPKAPQGLENNWIPTGEDFFLLFRLYGPGKPLFEKSWMLGDVERVR